MQSFGILDPIGGNKERSRVLEMQCCGHLEKDEFLSAYVIVEYRDIFGHKRETSMGYTIRSGDEIFRQYSCPDRNTNT